MPQNLAHVPTRLSPHYLSHIRVRAQDIVIPTIRDLREFLGAWRPFMEKFHLILVQVFLKKQFQELLRAHVASMPVDTWFHLPSRWFRMVTRTSMSRSRIGLTSSSTIGETSSLLLASEHGSFPSATPLSETLASSCRESLWCTRLTTTVFPPSVRTAN